jgi:hypothetical protein
VPGSGDFETSVDGMRLRSFLDCRSPDSNPVSWDFKALQPGKVPHHFDRRRIGRWHFASRPS